MNILLASHDPNVTEAIKLYADFISCRVEEVQSQEQLEKRLEEHPHPHCLLMDVNYLTEHNSYVPIKRAQEIMYGQHYDDGSLVGMTGDYDLAEATRRDLKVKVLNKPFGMDTICSILRMP